MPPSETIECEPFPQAFGILLVGLTYRRQLGRKWRILIQGDGGGFGVGSDGGRDRNGPRRVAVSLVISGLPMDTAACILATADTVDGRTLTISPTLHGPIFDWAFSSSREAGILSYGRRKRTCFLGAARMC